MRKILLMIEISPQEVKKYKFQNIPSLLFSWMEGDANCINNEICLKMLQDMYKRETKINILKVSWIELNSIFKIPTYVNRYTIFYLRYGLTAGTIENQDIHTLKNFFLKCNEISFNLKYPSLKYPPVTVFIEDPFNRYNIRLFSKLSLEYQFEEKPKDKSINNLQNVINKLWDLTAEREEKAQQKKSIRRKISVKNQREREMLANYVKAIAVNGQGKKTHVKKPKLTRFEKFRADIVNTIQETVPPTVVVINNEGHIDLTDTTKLKPWTQPNIHQSIKSVSQNGLNIKNNISNEQSIIKYIDLSVLKQKLSIKHIELENKSKIFSQIYNEPILQSILFLK